MELRFTVPGPPVPKARARVVNGHSYTPAKTMAYERLVAFTAAAARNRLGVDWPRDARYALDVTVYVPTRRRSDADNFLKSVADAGNGILWKDDSQVDKMSVERIYDPKTPRIVVAVRTL